jgi:hypothetical protein
MIGSSVPKTCFLSSCSNPCIEFEVVFILKGERVMDIDVEEMDKDLENSDPNDQGHKPVVNPLRCPASEKILAINVTLPLEAHNLFDLPERVHRHVPINLRDVGFPEIENGPRTLMSEISKTIC